MKSRDSMTRRIWASCTAAAVAPCSICARRSSFRGFWGGDGDDEWTEQCKHVRLSSINDEVAVGIWAVEHGAPRWKLQTGRVGGGQQSVKDAATQAIEYRRETGTSPLLDKLMVDFRKVVSFNNADRILHYDMKKACAFLDNDPNKYLQ